MRLSNDIEQRIKGIPMFADLSADDYEEILRSMLVVRVSKGKPVVRQGDRGDSMFFIIKGKALVSIRDRTGNPLPIAVLPENAFFGEMALLSGQPRNASVSTLSDTILLKLSKANLKRAMAKHNEIKKILESYYDRRIHELETTMRAKGMIERRGLPRLNAALQGRFRTSLQEEGRFVSRIIHGATENITERGACMKVEGTQLMSMKSRPVGSNISLELDLPHSVNVVRAVGEIIWYQEAERKLEMRFNVGISFKEISKHDLQNLRRFIAGDMEEEGKGG